MTLDPNILNSLHHHTANLHPELSLIRRALHQHPELSGEESWTSAFIAEKLEKLGLLVQTRAGGFGIIADWITDPAKPTVALRVDMDALPISEINDVPYRSQVPGVMHACGHDVHSAVGFGTAAVLAELGKNLPGNIRFIFQPEEEEITGALRMIRAGALIDPVPRAILGLHVAPLPVGKIAWTDNLFLAGFEHYLAKIIPGDRSAASSEKLDAVAKRCCQVIKGFNRWTLPETRDEMQAMWKLMQSNDPDLQHFTIFDASTDEEDLIARRGQFGIGIKAASHALRRAAIGRVKASLNTITQANQTHYQLEPMGSMPDVRNHPELVQATLPALRQVIGAPNAIQLKAAFPFNCEDFAIYTKLIPGAMYWVGAANPQKGQFAMLHTPNFDVDETCLTTGVMAMSALLIGALQQDF